MRTGIIAKKIGMTKLYTEEGQHLPVTVLDMKGCQVIGVRSQEKDGYTSLRLGYGVCKEKHLTQPMKKAFEKAGVEPRKTIIEFRVTDDCLLDVGSELLPSHFVDGQFVDVTAQTIGKGFAGGMKRHNFGGLRASHGVSVSHRSIGSTGNRQDPGKVFKGKKMPGHMGDTRVTVQNLKIVKTDDERGLIFVRGAIPGAINGIVRIRDAVKRIMPKDAPLPGKIVAKESTKKETKAADTEVVVETQTETQVES